MRRKVLKEIAREVGAEESIEGSLEIVGDIAILRFPVWIKPTNPELLERISKKLIEKFPYIKSVWLSATPIYGEERIRRLIHLAGEERTRTIYREHGVSFLVDIAKAYISPRLSYEHMRVAKLVGEGEIVTNFFSGIGGFSLVIAKHSKAGLVNSIDINREAVELQKESIILNGLEGRVRVFHGDARNIAELYLRESSDRILLPLPGIDETFYQAALKALAKRGGFLHVYEFVSFEDDPNVAIEEKFREIESMIMRFGWAAHLKNVRKVRSVGPRKVQVVFDIEARPLL